MARRFPLLSWTLTIWLGRALPLTPADFRVKGLDAFGCMGE